MPKGAQRDNDEDQSSHDNNNGPSSVSQNSMLTTVFAVEGSSHRQMVTLKVLEIRNYHNYHEHVEEIS